MPYISSKSRRRDIDASVAMYDHPRDAGELNFVITRTIDKYLDEKGVSYHTLNEVTGVLEAVKMELYRRVIAPYEDKKITDNGDVYRVLKPAQIVDPTVLVEHDEDDYRD